MALRAIRNGSGGKDGFAHRRLIASESYHSYKAALLPNFASVARRKKQKNDIIVKNPDKMKKPQFRQGVEILHPARRLPRPARFR